MQKYKFNHPYTEDCFTSLKDGPNIFTNGFVIQKSNNIYRFMKDGGFHRDHDLPAISSASYKAWYTHNFCHRTKGPSQVDLYMSNSVSSQLIYRILGIYIPSSRFKVIVL